MAADTTNPLIGSLIDELKKSFKPFGEFLANITPATAYLKQLSTQLQNQEIFARSNIDIAKVNKIFGQQIQSVGGNYAENLKQVAVNFDTGIRNTGSKLLTLQKELRQTGVDTTQSAAVFAELYGLTGGNTESLDKLSDTILDANKSQQISISQFIEGISKISQELKDISVLADDPMLATNIRTALEQTATTLPEASKAIITDLLLSNKYWPERIRFGLQPMIEEFRKASPEEMAKMFPDILRTAQERMSQAYGLRGVEQLEQRRAILGDFTPLYASLTTAVNNLNDGTGKIKDVVANVAAGAGPTLTSKLEEALSKTLMTNLFPNKLGGMPAGEAAIEGVQNISKLFDNMQEGFVGGALGIATTVLTAPIELMINGMNAAANMGNLFGNNVQQGGIAMQNAIPQVQGFSSEIEIAAKELTNFAGSVQDLNNLIESLKTAQAPTKQQFIGQATVTEQNLKNVAQSISNTFETETNLALKNKFSSLIPNQTNLPGFAQEFAEQFSKTYNIPLDTRATTKLEQYASDVNNGLRKDSEENRILFARDIIGYFKNELVSAYRRIDEESEKEAYAQQAMERKRLVDQETIKLQGLVGAGKDEDIKRQIVVLANLIKGQYDFLSAYLGVPLGGSNTSNIGLPPISLQSMFGR